MATLDELNERFAIRDHLSFHFHDNAPGGLVEMRVVTQDSEATIFTYGAHITRWNPKGEQPVLYLSPESAFTPGKAIRGGTPVIFPWFGPGWDGAHKPSHGFGRTSFWTVARTHLKPDGEVEVALTLEPTELSRSLGYSDFLATMHFRIGSALFTELEATNTGGSDMVYEDALHTYFAVGDIADIEVEGLQGTTYLDKRDEGIRKVQQERMQRFTRDLDQVHVQTTNPLTIHDAAWRRSIQVEKHGSNSTVTWNPWSVLTPGLPDLPEDGWRHFVCVEACNAGDDRLTLAPSETHRTGTRITVRKTQ